jgi:hypothetical protein
VSESPEFAKNDVSSFLQHVNTLGVNAESEIWKAYALALHVERTSGPVVTREKEGLNLERRGEDRSKVDNLVCAGGDLALRSSSPI